MANDPTQSFAQGVTEANAEQGGYSAEECADVKRWLEKIEKARDFDKVARQQYVVDRKIARGDGKFDVSVPIAQSYIDVLGSFIYAKNPDVDCSPSPATEPPPDRALLSQAREEAQQNAQQQAQQIGAMAINILPQLAQSGALPQIAQAVQQAPEEIENDAKQRAVQMAKPFKQDRQDAKQFATTMELVISTLWEQAKLKKSGKAMTRSALTIGLGVLKVTWQERAGQDPVTVGQIDDLQDNLKRLQASMQELAEGEGKDADLLKASIEQQMQGLQGNVEVLAERGVAIDFVPAEDITFPQELTAIENYLDSPWLGHRVFVPVEEACAQFTDCDDDKIKNAKLYYPKKPTDFTKKREAAGAQENVDATQADRYRDGGAEEGTPCVCIHEIQDRSSNIIRTVMEGLDCYAKKPFTPIGTSRFYSLFIYTIGNIDGERHPKSLINRSADLFAEYDRTRSNWRKVRQRSIPKTGFDKSKIEPAEVKAIEGVTEQEMVGFAMTDPTMTAKDAVFPIAYARVDPAIYDTAPIRAELETIWGVQEALSSSIHTAKTATEAEIQQTGTNSRTSYMRDDQDELFTDLAQYTAEIAIQKLDREDVVKMAGSYALWPQALKVDDLSNLISIKTTAGSTGKPNNSLKQQVWASVMPIVKDSIIQIGQLRGSSPAQVAECLESLVQETLHRTGDRIEAERFLPGPPDQQEAPPADKGPPQPLADTAYQGQQTQALTTILDQTRQGILSPQSALAVIKASYPTIPDELVQQMVEGVAQAAPPPPMPAEPPQQTIQ